MRTIICGAAALAMLLVSACATTTAQVEATIQPRHPAAAQLKRIAVLGFSGPGGDDFSARLESTLFSAGAGGVPHFSVVERNTFEGSIGVSTWSSEARAVQAAVALGRRVGVQGVYTGAVDRSQNRVRSQEQRTRCLQYERNNTIMKKCLQEQQYYVNCTKLDVTLTTIPKLVNISTGGVIYTRPISNTQSTRWCDDRPQTASEENLVYVAMGVIATEIAHDVAPWNAVMNVDLMTEAEGLSPEDAELFKGAAAFARAGRIDRACGTYDDLYGKYADSVEVIYNRGVCAETTGDFSKALQYYTDADSRLTRPNATINTALTRARALMSGRTPGS